MPISVALALNKARYTEGRMWLHILQASTINAKEYHWEFCGLHDTVQRAEQLSRYSEGLRADGSGSIPGKDNFFLFSTASRPVLGAIKPPIQWVLGGSFPGSKAAGA
jgi:hypothetical protein